jgi:hypothetical protein
MHKSNANGLFVSLAGVGAAAAAAAWWQQSSEIKAAVEECSSVVEEEGDEANKHAALVEFLAKMRKITGKVPPVKQGEEVPFEKGPFAGPPGADGDNSRSSSRDSPRAGPAAGSAGGSAAAGGRGSRGGGLSWTAGRDRDAHGRK